MKSSLRILIIDDLDSIRKDLKSNLELVGYSNVDEATDGRVALEMVRVGLADNRPYELFFCDINMPNMNGIDFLKHIRAVDIHRKTPILMVSTENEKEIIVQCILLGATDYMLKPYTKEKLQEKMVKIEGILAK